LLFPLEYFATPEEAARASYVAARDRFGEFAALNFSDRRRAGLRKSPSIGDHLTVDVRAVDE
jgi:hypothetical protein